MTNKKPYFLRNLEMEAEILKFSLEKIQKHGMCIRGLRISLKNIDNKLKKEIDDSWNNSNQY